MDPKDPKRWHLYGRCPVCNRETEVVGRGPKKHSLCAGCLADTEAEVEIEIVQYESLRA